MSRVYESPLDCVDDDGYVMRSFACDCCGRMTTQGPWISAPNWFWVGEWTDDLDGQTWHLCSKTCLCQFVLQRAGR